jgi:hypothetical protein
MHKSKKKSKQITLDVLKLPTNIKLFVNIIHLILTSYILLIIFLPSGIYGLDSYFETQEKQSQDIDDTIKWVYKIIESITNESLRKEVIIENCIRFIELPMKEGNKASLILVIMKNQKIFHSTEGEITIDIDLFNKIAKQMQIVFNPIDFLENFILNSK